MVEISVSEVAQIPYTNGTISETTRSKQLEGAKIPRSLFGHSLANAQQVKVDHPMKNGLQLHQPNAEAHHPNQANQSQKKNSYKQKVSGIIVQ